jgi:N utilization substance protein A
VVEIKGIAREAGGRTKIAVKSNEPRIDAIGACVGMRGMRVKNITGELSGERIDIVEFDEDIKKYVANSMQPAKLKKIEVDEGSKSMDVLVDPDQSRLAYGKKAQNVRLTSKLLGWNIKIIVDEEIKEASFEEKLHQAIESLSEAMDLDEELVGKLVKNGYISVDGIKASSREDLSSIDDMTEEDIDRIFASLENL